MIMERQAGPAKRLITMVSGMPLLTSEVQRYRILSIELMTPHQG